jgi:hypothetical protein
MGGEHDLANLLNVAACTRARRVVTLLRIVVDSWRASEVSGALDPSARAARQLAGGGAHKQWESVVPSRSQQQSAAVSRSQKNPVAVSSSQKQAATVSSSQQQSAVVSSSQQQSVAVSSS